MRGINREPKIVAALVRHAESTGSLERRNFYIAPSFKPIAAYQDVLTIFNKVQTPKQVPVAELTLRRPMKQLLPIIDRYKTLGADSSFPIVEGEGERAQQIGYRLERYLRDIKRVQVAEIRVSPTVRTIQTAGAMQSGMRNLRDIPVTFDDNLEERRVPESVKQMVYRKLYFVEHPAEWIKFLKKGKKYKEPLQEGDSFVVVESDEEFSTRVKNSLRRLARRKQKGLEIDVTHSGYMREVVKQLGGNDEHINTGAVVFVYQKPRLLFKPGKLYVDKPYDFVPRRGN